MPRNDRTLKIPTFADPTDRETILETYETTSPLTGEEWDKYIKEHFHREPGPVIQIPKEQQGQEPRLEDDPAPETRPSHETDEITAAPEQEQTLAQNLRASMWDDPLRNLGEYHADRDYGQDPATWGEWGMDVGGAVSTRLVGNVYRGFYEAVSDTVDTARWLTGTDDVEALDTVTDFFADYLAPAKAPQTGADQIVSFISSFFIPFAALGKLSKGVKAARAVSKAKKSGKVLDAEDLQRIEAMGMFSRSAIVNFVAQDPASARPLFDMLAEGGAQFLDADPDLAASWLNTIYAEDSELSYWEQQLYQRLLLIGADVAIGGAMIGAGKALKPAGKGVAKGAGAAARGVGRTVGGVGEGIAEGGRILRAGVGMGTTGHSGANAAAHAVAKGGVAVARIARDLRGHTFMGRAYANAARRHSGEEFSQKVVNGDPLTDVELNRIDAYLPKADDVSAAKRGNITLSFRVKPGQALDLEDGMTEEALERAGYSLSDDAFEFVEDVSTIGASDRVIRVANADVFWLDPANARRSAARRAQHSLTTREYGRTEPILRGQINLAHRFVMLDKDPVMGHADQLNKALDNALGIDSDDTERAFRLLQWVTGDLVAPPEIKNLRETIIHNVADVLNITASKDNVGQWGPYVSDAYRIIYFSDEARLTRMGREMGSARAISLASRLKQHGAGSDDVDPALLRLTPDELREHMEEIGLGTTGVPSFGRFSPTADELPIRDTLPVAGLAEDGQIPAFFHLNNDTLGTASSVERAIDRGLDGLPGRIEAQVAAARQSDIAEGQLHAMDWGIQFETFLSRWRKYTPDQRDQFVRANNASHAQALGDHYLTSWAKEDAYGVVRAAHFTSGLSKLMLARRKVRDTVGRFEEMGMSPDAVKQGQGLAAGSSKEKLAGKLDALEEFIEENGDSIARDEFRAARELLEEADKDFGTARLIQTEEELQRSLGVTQSRAEYLPRREAEALERVNALEVKLKNARKDKTRAAITEEIQQLHEEIAGIPTRLETAEEIIESLQKRLEMSTAVDNLRNRERMLSVIRKHGGRGHTIFGGVGVGKTAAALSNAPSTEAIEFIARERIKSGALDTIAQTRIGAMLTSPQTHVRNVASVQVADAETTLSRRMGDIAGELVYKAPTKSDIDRQIDEQAFYYSMRQAVLTWRSGLIEGLDNRAWSRNFREGAGTFGQNSAADQMDTQARILFGPGSFAETTGKLEHLSRGTARRFGGGTGTGPLHETAQLIQRAEGWVSRAWKGHHTVTMAEGGLSRRFRRIPDTINLSTGSLGVQDNGWRAAFYIQNKRRIAYKKAIELDGILRERISPAEYANRRIPFDDIEAMAWWEARNPTFTGVTGKYTSALMEAREWIGPGGKIVTPFVPAVSNIARYAGRSTGIPSLMNVHVLRTIAAGGPAAEEAMGRIAAGTMLMSAGISLSADGILKLPLNSLDPKDQPVAKALGEDMAIVLPDGSTISLASMDPAFLTALALGAGIHQLYRDYRWEEQDYMDLLGGALTQVAARFEDLNFADKQFKFIELFDPRKTPQEAKALAEEFAKVGTQPLGGAGNWFLKLMDPYTRYTQSHAEETGAALWGRIANRALYNPFSGATKDQPMSYDVIGRPVTKYDPEGGPVAAFLGLAAPFTYKSVNSAEEQDAVHMLRFIADYGERISFPSKDVFYSFDFGSIPVRLTEEEYSRFSKARGEFIRTELVTMKETLDSGDLKFFGEFSTALRTVVRLANEQAKAAIVEDDATFERISEVLMQKAEEQGEILLAPLGERAR